MYKITHSGKSKYVFSDEERDKYLRRVNAKNVKIQRYKGLGEMNPHELWNTTLDPEHRQLKKVVIQDFIESDETFSILMGDNVESRRKFIMENSKLADLDI